MHAHLCTVSANMNDIQKFLNRIQELTPCAASELKKVISPEQVVLALSVDLGISLENLALQSWDEETFVAELSKCKSIKELPEVIGCAEFEESILHENGSNIAFDEFVKSQGEQWFIHKHDADPFPSNPHAHNYQKGLKLHLGNGKLYSGTKLVGRLRKKSFLALREKVKYIDLPDLDY